MLICIPPLKNQRDIFFEMKYNRSYKSRCDCACDSNMGLQLFSQNSAYLNKRLKIKTREETIYEFLVEFQSFGVKNHELKILSNREK